MMHALKREQWLPVNLADAWNFFSTPRNLARITPPELGLVIQEPFDEQPIYPGQRITYTVRPLLGVPLKWISMIADVVDRRRFIDVQIQGPYAHWWHEHVFREGDGGVWMTDKVQYALPLGPLGRLTCGTFVRRRLEEIFDFRRDVLARLLPAARTI